MENLINYAIQIEELAGENGVDTALIEHCINLVEKNEEDIRRLKVLLNINITKLTEAIVIANGKVQKELLKKEIQKL